MLSRRKHFFIIAIIISLITILAYINNNYKQEDNKNILSKNRNTEFYLYGIHRLSDNLSADLLQPKYIRVSSGSVYIADWGSFSIKRFDKDGRLLNQIGEGKGRGPGEFLLLAPFDVYNDTLWALDPKQRRISVFTDTGTFVRQFDTDEYPHSVAVSEEVIEITRIFGNVFSTYDRKGVKLDTFGQLTEDQNKNPLAVEGTLEQDGSSFFYKPLYASYLYRLSDVSIEDTVQTLDNQEYPSPRKSNSKSFSAPTPPIRYADVEADGDNIYVLTNADSVSDGRRRSVKHSYLDVYARNTYEYRGSARVSPPTSYIEVLNDTLYAMRDTSVSAYKIRRTR